MHTTQCTHTHTHSYLHIYTFIPTHIHTPQQHTTHTLGPRSDPQTHNSLIIWWMYLAKPHTLSPAAWLRAPNLWEASQARDTSVSSASLAGMPNSQATSNTDCSSQNSAMNSCDAQLWNSRWQKVVYCRFPLLWIMYAVTLSTMHIKWLNNPATILDIRCFRLKVPFKLFLLRKFCYTGNVG